MGAGARTATMLAVVGLAGAGLLSPALAPDVLAGVEAVPARAPDRSENGETLPDADDAPPYVWVSPEPAVAPEIPATTGSVPEPGAPSLRASLTPDPSLGESLALPEPPVAEVTITPSEALTGAIAARLEDGRRPLSSRLGKKEREAIAAVYARAGYRPIWIQDRSWSAPALAVIERLAAARDDGLNPADYAVPTVKPQGAEQSPADLADAELKLSAAAVLYARDARGGRLDPSRLSNLITPKLDLPAAEAVLTALAAGGSGAGGLLAAYNPVHAGYRALKAKLAEIRTARPVAAPASAPVPYGPMISVGMSDPRVPLVRARFGLGPVTEDARYDEPLASAVAAFQRQKGLVPSGVLTRQTVAALSPPVSRPSGSEADIIANMERWRWLPAELGARHIEVNIPEFKVRVIEQDRAAYEARVIVGKPETPTPVFSGTMEYAIVNPSWNIPPSILKNEFLPKLAKDPDYAARLGYEVVRKGNSIAIRQPPGERNALGNIKFMFPNQHAVYLHDTPNRTLFSTARRSFSHGCVRVDQPMKFAEIVLGPRWSADRVQALVGRGERMINLPQRLPVHLTYFTSFVDEHGDLRSAEDLYGYNRRVRAALGLDG